MPILFNNIQPPQGESIMAQPAPRVESVLAGRDNIIWMIATGPTTFAAVDPGEADPVSDFLTTRQATLSHLLITHHHGDHIGGIDTLRQRHGGQVVGARADAGRLPRLTVAVNDGDRLPLDDTLTAEVLAVPGHTLGHVAYRVGDALFSGDTLFGFGCGRLFEGSPAQMWSSLSRLRTLPDATRLFAGHEYTLANLDFVCALEPERTELYTLRQEFIAITDAGGLTLPHPLAMEKRFNPFLRADDPALASSLGWTGTDPVTLFAMVRERRNRF
ncbi:MAG: hydroxyacylglutathione hydrolase [Magnetococcales bacterium]|nr:hydroxyacylglutathione hydrolase [Magnetococcales bacterium]